MCLALQEERMSRRGSRAVFLECVATQKNRPANRRANDACLSYEQFSISVHGLCGKLREASSFPSNSVPVRHHCDMT